MKDLDFAALIFLWILEGLMAVFAAWLVKKGSEIKAPREALKVLYPLSMMALMFISIVVYLYSPGVLAGLVPLDMWLMLILTFFFAVFYYLGPKTLDENLAGMSLKSIIIALIIALILLSEVLMAWTFALIEGTASTAGGLQGIFATLTSSSSSFWFIFMSSAEMGITLFLIRDKLPKAIGVIMASQTVIMTLSPTAIANSLWADFSLAAGSAVMIFLFIYIFEFMYKNRAISSGILNYLFLNPLSQSLNILLI